MDRNYAIEEQELKLMLKTDNEKRIEKQTQNLFDDWENVIFGTNILAAEQSCKDVNNFIIIRYIFNVEQLILRIDKNETAPQSEV